MAKKVAKPGKKDALDPYGVAAAFPCLDFPYWEQTVLHAWLVKNPSSEEMMSKDAWTLWEAVFWVRFNREPPLFHIDNEHLKEDFQFKALVLAQAIGLDTALLDGQISELNKLYDAAKRAIIVGKIEGYESQRAFWVVPKSFIAWDEEREKRKIENSTLTKDKRKSIREKCYQKIKEFAKSQPYRVPLRALIESPEISDLTAMYIRLAPSQKTDKGYNSLLDRLRKDDEVPKIDPGKQIRK